jgi:hypothetical protein
LSRHECQTRRNCRAHVCAQCRVANRLTVCEEAEKTAARNDED